MGRDRTTRRRAPGSIGHGCSEHRPPSARQQARALAQGSGLLGTGHQALGARHGAPGSRLRVPRASGIGAAGHHFLVFQTEDGPQPKRDQTRMGGRALAAGHQAPCAGTALRATGAWHGAPGFWLLGPRAGGIGHQGTGGTVMSPGKARISLLRSRFGTVDARDWF